MPRPSAHTGADPGLTNTGPLRPQPAGPGVRHRGADLWQRRDVTAEGDAGPGPPTPAREPAGADAPGPIASGGAGSAGMPPWLPRAILLAVAAVAGLRIAEWVFLQVRGLLTLLLISLFLSFAIEPAVNGLARRGWRRGAATGLVFAVMGVLGALLVFAVGSLVVNQVQGFIDAAPGYIDDLQRLLEERFDIVVDTDQIVADLTAAEGPLRDLATRLAGNALGFSAQVVGAVFRLFTVALFTFYLAADGPRLRAAICSVLPPARQREVLRTWDIAVSKTGGYLYSRLLLATMSAAATWVALSVIGVPYALALALWLGVVSQFVPVIGTYIGGVLPVLVALGHRPTDALWTLGFVVAYQQLENYLLAPRVTARTMDLHPAVAFGTVIAGAGLLGGVGAVLALPAAAILQAFVSTYVERHELIDELRPGSAPAPDRPPTGGSGADGGPAPGRGPADRG